jgi:hypothetical protein
MYVIDGLPGVIELVKSERERAEVDLSLSTNRRRRERLQAQVEMANGILASLMQATLVVNVNGSDVCSYPPSEQVR